MIEPLLRRLRLGTRARSRFPVALGEAGRSIIFAINRHKREVNDFACGKNN
jgi:hypothetical protein